MAGPGRGGDGLPCTAARFPAELLAELRGAVAADSLLRVGLWNGETLTLRRVVREGEAGLVGELDDESRPEDRQPPVVAIPWHAVVRVEAVPGPVRRVRPGFSPPAG